MRKGSCSRIKGPSSASSSKNYAYGTGTAIIAIISGSKQGFRIVIVPVEVDLHEMQSGKAI
jgi:hypothetical protein